MNDLGLTLLVKSTGVLTAGCFVALCFARNSASTRHFVWLCTLCIVLLLPLGLLLPAGLSPEPPAFLIADITAGVSSDTSRTPWPLIVWLTAAVALLARLAGSFIQAMRLVDSSRSLNGGGMVRVLDGITTPAAWGFGREAILLPVHACEWPEDRLKAVLRHEQAHLERKDCWSLLIAELACAIFWFHPLVWYAAHRLRAEQEHAADDHVLQDGASPEEYAAHLLTIAAACRTHPLLAGAAHRSALAGRIKAILDGRRKRSMLNRRTAVACLAAVAVLAVPIVAMHAKRKTYKVGQDGVTAPQPVFKPEPAYTQEARDAKIEGSVRLSAVIEDDGTVSEINVDSSLDEGLDANAVQAVSSWIFKPAEKDGVPVAVSVRIVVNFRLL